MIFNDFECHRYEKIKHRSPIQTEKSQRLGQWIMPVTSFPASGWDFSVVCIRVCIPVLCRCGFNIQYAALANECPLVCILYVCPFKSLCLSSLML